MVNILKSLPLVRWIQQFILLNQFSMIGLNFENLVLQGSWTCLAFYQPCISTCSTTQCMHYTVLTEELKTCMPEHVPQHLATVATWYIMHYITVCLLHNIMLAIIHATAPSGIKCYPSNRLAMVNLCSYLNSISSKVAKLVYSRLATVYSSYAVNTPEYQHGLII